jgi:predicted transcriptional regulator
MPAPSDPEFSQHLSKRERQVVEIVFRRGRATARDIERELPDPPTYSAVRSILRILVRKEVLRKTAEEGRDWYAPGVSVAKAKSGALQSLVRNFFADSVAAAACALLGQRKVKLSAEEASQLLKVIEEARKK